ncbi:MAG: B12-binding domain-containing radical SAM protein [Candidatus Thorarchaeota archaeon]
MLHFRAAQFPIVATGPTMVIDILIIDALSAGSGRRVTSRDAIGCGPRSVAGVLEASGLSCRIRRAEDVLTGRSGIRGFRHLAISAMTMDAPSVRRIIHAWRRHHQGIVVLGGPIATGGKQTLISLKPTVMVVGEGERTLDELIQAGLFEDAADLHAIDGIGFMDHDSPVFTTPRRRLTSQELDSYRPSVTRIMDYPAYQASRVYVEVLRGCSNFRRTTLELPDGRVCIDCGNCDSPSLAHRLDCPVDIPPGCGFCSVPSTWGPPRERSEQAIVDEVIGLLDLGVHRIVLEAPDFLDYRRGHSPQTDPCSPAANLEAIESLLSKLASLPQIAEGNAHLSIENVKACLFTDEVAALIAKYVHGTSPNIGLETGSGSHMRSIGKGGSPEDVVRAVRAARRHGMSPFVYLIYGLPGENEQTAEESIRLMKLLSDAGAERIILYGFQPLPRSAFAAFPPASPKSHLGRRLRRAAEDINRQKKTHYVGCVIRGVAAEPSLTHKGYTMVYPLGEGPIMTVLGGYSPGTVMKVRVIKPLSAGLLLGEVLHEDHCD